VALSTINPNNPAGNRPSLRLGAEDLPRVAHWYIGVGIRYAEFDGAQWHDEPIEPSAPCGREVIARLVVLP
jgi:hypothetical protein